MNVDEHIETLDLSVEEYQREHLNKKKGVSYTVAKPIRFSKRARNWYNSQFTENPTLQTPTETRDWNYQPEAPTDYSQASFVVTSETPLEAHVTGSMGAVQSPYNVEGTILGATTWSINEDSNIATPDGSYLFESRLEEVSRRWQAPPHAVEDQFKQSLENKLTPVSEKVNRSYESEASREEKTYRNTSATDAPVAFSQLRVV